MAAEALAIAVRQNKAIIGINIGKEETKLLQYADDITATLSDINSLVVLLDLLEVYKNASGLTINCTKTEGMWIGSLRNNKTKSLVLKWPHEPIKALGVYYSYDEKLLREKNFIENLDKIKKLINIWASRGLSLYGKVKIIKALVIPKMVYLFSLIPTPEVVVTELNQILYKFLWKSTDKVTRLSTINDYENGGLKMVDLECMIKSLRLAWLTRIFSSNRGTWKSYLRHLLAKYRGLFLFNCNFDVKDLSIHSQFYTELLQWWSDFREDFSSNKDWNSVIWNNKEIRVSGSPIFYKNYFDSDIFYVSDLLFNLNNTESFDVIGKKIRKTNFLVWTGLRFSVPNYLKNNPITATPSVTSPFLTIDHQAFDVMEKKSKQFYSLLIGKKAQLPSAASKLQREFNFSLNQLRQLFILPHKVTLEPYMRAFQFKVLTWCNSILYTNFKLYKIGYSQHDLCTFCKSYPEMLNHLLYNCSCSKAFWGDFELFWFSGTQKTINLTQQDVIVGVLSRSCPLLNYFLLVARIYLWDCRRNQIRPNINGFRAKILIKYETESYIARVNKKMEFLKEKWANCQFS